MNKKFLSSVLGIVLLTSACSSEDGGEKTETIRPVKTITVKAEGTVRIRSYPGVVLPAQRAELSFRASGQIIEFPIKAAAEVKEGDLIAKLDTKDFESQVASLDSQLEQAQAQLDALTSGARQEDVASLKANIAAAEAQVNAARQQFSRTSQLFEKGIVAKAKLDADQANLDVANAQLESARQELIKGQTGGRKEEVAAQVAAIKGIEANLNIAQDNLANATLRAPFDGIIARRDVDNFANIQAKQTIVVLQKLDKLELSFDIPGPDVAATDRQNLPSMTVTLDAQDGEVFPAEVVEFNTAANASTQTFTGRVSIDPPENVTVLPGMTGMVILTDQPKSGTAIGYKIPGSALGAEPDGSMFVWLVRDGAVAKQPIKTGKARGSDVEIIDGLSDGDTVVTAGLSYLQDKMKVRPYVKGE